MTLAQLQKQLAQQTHESQLRLEYQQQQLAHMMSGRQDQGIQSHLNNETDIMMQQHEHMQHLLQGQQSLNYEYSGESQSHQLNLSSQQLRELQHNQINILGHSSDSYEENQHLTGMGQSNYDAALDYIHDQYSSQSLS